MRRILAAAVAVAFAFSAVPGFAQEKLTVWWVKGFYKSEDDALYAAIKAYEAKNPGVKIELSQYAVQDMIPKSVAALDAGTPPDIAYSDTYDVQVAGKWAFDGKLDDISDVITPMEAALLLVGIPVLLWTLIPLYHMFLFAISPKDAAFSGQLWPTNPTLRNFEMVIGQKHHFLYHFWQQMFNSLVISAGTAALTLFVATTAAFSISRLRVKGGRLVMNLGLFTYFIPAAFLAVPMYKAMGMYGLLNNDWALVLAMVTLASPYAIWILRQASDKLLQELDEAAMIDGASPLQLFRLIYLPLMVPSLIAVGTYALLLAWNEYLYAFLLLSRETAITLPVALGNFLSADDSPWELLMTAGFLYALPPAAIYYAFRQYMASGLTAGAVKG